MKTEIDFLKIPHNYLPSLSVKASDHSHLEKQVSFPVKESACGKAIIVGEHAVVYGAKAIALPLKALRLELSMTKGEKTDAKNEDLSKSQQKLQWLVHETCKELGLAKVPHKLEAQSNILMGAGLGSSAALCVALVRLCLKLNHKNLSSKAIACVAQKLEKNFHGNSSGLDTSIVSYEKPFIFQKNQPPKILKISPLILSGKKHPWPFVLIDSGFRASTHIMIQKAKPFFTSKNERQIIDSFNHIASSTSKAFENGDIKSLAHNMTQTQIQLEDAGLLNEVMLKQKQMILNCDVLSVKITGAGGGGCFLSLLDPESFELQFKNLSKLFGSHNLYSIFI